MTKREQLEQDAKLLRQKAEELESQIKALPCAGGRWKPQPGAYYYYYVRSTGQLEQAKYGKAANKDEGRYEACNMFRTKAEAELHRLRMESMTRRWMPSRDGETIYIYRFGRGIYGSNWYEGWYNDSLIGAVHPSEQTAKNWYNKYGKAWEILLEKEKTA